MCMLGIFLFLFLSSVDFKAVFAEFLREWSYSHRLEGNCTSAGMEEGVKVPPPIILHRQPLIVAAGNEDISVRGRDSGDEEHAFPDQDNVFAASEDIQDLIPEPDSRWKN